MMRLGGASMGRLQVGFKIRVWLRKRNVMFPQWMMRLLERYEMYFVAKNSMKNYGVAMQTFSGNGKKYLVLKKFKPRYSTVCFGINDEDVTHNKGVNPEDFNLSERFKEAYTDKKSNEKQKP
jgi:hypothetical protein